MASPPTSLRPGPTIGTVERKTQSMHQTNSLLHSPPLLVCHSHLRWDWVYQRPQHLLSRLARDWPVIVEEEPLFDDRPPGMDILSVAEGVTVIRPHRRPGQDFDLGMLDRDSEGADDGLSIAGRASPATA